MVRNIFIASFMCAILALGGNGYGQSSVQGIQLESHTAADLNGNAKVDPNNQPSSGLVSKTAPEIGQSASPAPQNPVTNGQPAQEQKTAATLPTKKQK